MAKTLVAKQSVIDAALDVKFDPSKIKTEEPIIPDTQKVERLRNTKVEIEREAKNLKPEEIDLVHTALARLSAVCNFASSYDYAGFNKVDARIGHDLSDRPFLSAKQAALGKRIIRKYRKQLEGLGVNIEGLYL